MGERRSNLERHFSRAKERVYGVDERPRTPVNRESRNPRDGCRFASAESQRTRKLTKESFNFRVADDPGIVVRPRTSSLTQGIAPQLL
jgi:hypothetical protein